MNRGTPEGGVRRTGVLLGFPSPFSKLGATEESTLRMHEYPAKAIVLDFGEHSLEATGSRLN